MICLRIFLLSVLIGMGIVSAIVGFTGRGAHLLSRITQSAHLFTTNSLWYQSGTKLYTRRKFLKHAFWRRVGTNRLLRLKTGLSILVIAIAFGVLAGLVLWWPGVGLTVISTDIVRAAWGVLASLISVAFLVIVFLLQYIENEYHNTTITKQFISRTYIIPAIYLSLFVLIFLGYVLAFQAGPSNELGQQWSTLVLTTVFAVPVSIGIVYYKITKEIFGQPLTRSLVDELKRRVQMHLDAQVHRAIAQGMIEDTELNGEKPGLRNNSDSDTIGTPKIHREGSVPILGKANQRTAKSVKRKNRAPKIRYRPLLPESSFRRHLADIDLTKLKRTLEPLYLYEDHIAIELHSHAAHENPALAIVEAYPTKVDHLEESQYNLPVLDNSIRLSKADPWRQPIVDEMNDFRELITESIEDGEISTVVGFLETTYELNKQVIQRLENIEREHPEINIQTDQLGQEVSKELATTYAHLYLKLSTTRYIDETARVLEELHAMNQSALEKGHDAVVSELLGAFEECYARERQDIHSQRLPEASEKLVSLLRRSLPNMRSQQARGTTGPRDPLESGIWQEVAQLNLKLLLRVIHSEADPTTFCVHWNRLYEISVKKFDVPQLTEPSDVLPLIWYLSLGHLCDVYSQGVISSEYYKKALTQTVLTADLSLEDAISLLRLAQHYEESGYESLALEEIFSEAGIRSNSGRQHVVLSDLFIISFICIASLLLEIKPSPDEPAWVSSLETDEMDSIIEMLDQRVQFSLDIGGREIATDDLKEILIEARKERPLPSSSPVDDMRESPEPTDQVDSSTVNTIKNSEDEDSDIDSSDNDYSSI